MAIIVRCDTSVSIHRAPHAFSVIQIAECLRSTCSSSEKDNTNLDCLAGWMQQGHVESYYLESIVGSITNQKTVPFGDGIISTNDTCFACETCEELFTPTAPRKL